MAADQFACTEVVLREVPDAAIVANLGVASWVLLETEDREKNFYMRGAMGGTTPTGLGVALAIDDPIVVLDGDGSLLMSLGCLSTVAEYAPEDFTIVVWDNRVFATTGGQPTLPADFAAAAEACGMAGFSAETDGEFEAAFEEAIAHDGPALVSARVERVERTSSSSYSYGHAWLKRRFRDALTGGQE